MKIHILFPFQEGPRGGGGNQFLKALKYYWISSGVYEQDIQKADVVIFNSHQFLGKVIKAKKKFPNKVFIHRIDGPMRGYRPKEAFLDELIFKINKFVADGTVWQSKWSQKQNKALFPYENSFETVIYNAPNEQVFNKKEKADFKKLGKIKIIAVSWSSNPLKGFDIYKFLDENLNFNKYEMLFVGKSPVQFKNIKVLGLMKHTDLSKQIKQSDIFISGSKIESCSNVLIEALSCSLPCLAFNSSSNPEIIGKGGELFSNTQELLVKIEKVANNYNNYQKNVPVFSLSNIAKQYQELAIEIYDQAQSGFYKTREVGVMAEISFSRGLVSSFFQKVLNKFKP